MSVTLKCNFGEIKIELFCELAPRTCENFLALCAKRYYENCQFHRSMKGFMVQTGDPTGTGKGGESIWGGYFESEFHKALKHDARGIVSMANKGPDTNGSQFFITYSKQEHLDGQYPVFGKIIGSSEYLDYLEKQPVDSTHRPLNELVITSVKIHANPFADANKNK